MEGPGDGNVYGAFITRQLDAQRERKESLERRAAGVITTSGVLVTLLFALTAITTKARGYKLPAAAHTPLLIALFSFVVASALAIVALLPFFYEAPTPQGLAEVVALPRWRNRDWVARRRVAGTEVKLIEKAQRSNKWKARILTGAGLAQVAALVALGMTVATMLTSSAPSHKEHTSSGAPSTRTSARPPVPRPRLWEMLLLDVIHGLEHLVIAGS